MSKVDPTFKSETGEGRLILRIAAFAAIFLVLSLAIYGVFFDRGSAGNPIQVSIVSIQMTSLSDGSLSLSVLVRNNGVLSISLRGSVGSLGALPLSFTPAQIGPGETAVGVATISTKVADFSGFSGYLHVPNAPSLNPSTFTVELGFRYHGYDPDQQMIFDKGAAGPDGVYFYNFRSVNNVNDFVVYENNSRSDQQLGYVFTPGLWYTLSFTSDGHTVRAYVNGVLVRSWSNGFLYRGNSDDLFIGQCTCGGYNFNGSMSFFRLYGSALSDAEIQQNYALASPNTRSLALWLVFNETSGTNIPDLSGKGNNATVQGNVSFVPPLNPCDSYSFVITVTTTDGRHFSFAQNERLAC